jgi:hypothetical protein
MRTTVRLLSVAAVLTLATGFRDHGLAQTPPVETGRAISTVMDHRLTYLADSIPFDACTVREALGGAEDFPSHIVPHVRSLLDDPVVTCPRPRSSRQGRSVVLVDSVRSHDWGVRVHVTVLRGELVHREDYDLVPGSSPVYMGVRQVRLWGHSQAYPPRPPRSP